MNLRKILTPVVAGLFLLAMAAQARYVFVLPAANATTPTLLGYSAETMTTMGSVVVPAGTNQVLMTPDGTKAIILAQNGTSPLSFVNIQGGQFSGAVRSYTLDGSQAIKAMLSPDGTKLLILTTAGNGSLYIVDPNTESVFFFGKVPINYTPRDMVVTQNSKYAAVICNSGLLVFIDITAGTIANSLTTNIGNTGSLGIAPTGNVYLTGLYNLISFEGRPPFSQIARTGLVIQAGKLMFAPDGRYALASNDSTNGSSVVTIDTGITAADTPAGAQISQLALQKPNGALLRLDDIKFMGSTAAVGFSAETQKMYSFGYPTLSGGEFYVPGTGYVNNVQGIAASNEITGPRSLYFLTSSGLTRQDMTTGLPFGTIPLSGGGGLSFQAAPSRETVAQLAGFNGNQTVGPNVALKPYFLRALDVLGRPVAGATVIYSAQTAGTALGELSTVTNNDGFAWVTGVSPNVNGAFVIRASVGTQSVDFTSYVTGATSGGGGGSGGGGTVGAPHLVKVSGDGQAITPFNSWSPAPVVVQLLDADNKPMAGKTVTWTATEGINLGAAIVTTDAEGKANVQWAMVVMIGLGEAFRTYNITANTDYGNISFKEIGFPLASQLNKGWSSYQLTPTLSDGTITAKLGSTVTAAIVTQSVTSGINSSSGGQPIPNMGLFVTSDNQDASSGPVASCYGGTVLSDESGYAKCDLVVTGKVGSTRLRANIAGEDTGIPITLVAIPGDPGKPAIVSGNNQTAKVGASFTAPLVARITDGAGNNLAGTTVIWSPVTSGNVSLASTVSTSDANGIVSTRVVAGSAVGKFQVKVAVGTKETVYDLTVESLAVAFTKISGDAQSGVATSTAFPLPLVVKVSDAAGNGVTGVTVGWSVTSGSAILSDTTTTTRTGGLASITATAGPLAGNIVITASVSGLGTQSFTLQSRVPGPGITASSFANWATGTPEIAPGNLILITGSGLATGISGTVSSDLLSGSLPTSLAGVSVSFKYGSITTAAPIYRVSNLNGAESVLVQAPYEITGSTVDAIVTVSGGSTSVTGLPVVLVSPGILESFTDGRMAAVAIREDGKVVTKATPARRGEKIRIYTIGLGQTTPKAVTNQVGVPDQNVSAAIAVGIDNKGVAVISAQMAENLVGVYEIIFQVPADATIGSDRPLGFVMEAIPGKQVYANGSVIAIGN